MRTHARSLLGLHLLLALYSVTNIFSKLASEQSFLSWQFVVYYGMVLLILGVYAIGWQQAIKRMPLTTAYANKAVTVVWGIVFGAVLFGEGITVPKVIGAALIIAGVVWFGIEDGRCQAELEAQMRADLSRVGEGTVPSAQTASAPHSGACRTAPGDSAFPSCAHPSAAGLEVDGADRPRDLTLEGGKRGDVQ